LGWALLKSVLVRWQLLSKTGKTLQVYFDLAKRIDLRANKKAIENLALAGGFDSL
jgi:hypothetical protein